MLRIAYRQIHFGETAPPVGDGAAVDRLILHRETLEAMIEDRYW